MAKVELSALIRGIHGTLGNVVFKTTAQGEVIMARRPARSRAKPSPAQKAQRQKFKQAQAYAKAAMRHPELQSHYEQLGARTRSHSSPHQPAATDYLRGNDLFVQRSLEDQTKVS